MQVAKQKLRQRLDRPIFRGRGRPQDSVSSLDGYSPVAPRDGVAEKLKKSGLGDALKKALHSGVERATRGVEELAQRARPEPAPSLDLSDFDDEDLAMTLEAPSMREPQPTRRSISVPMTPQAERQTAARVAQLVSRDASIELGELLAHHPEAALLPTRGVLPLRRAIDLEAGACINVLLNRLGLLCRGNGLQRQRVDEHLRAMLVMAPPDWERAQILQLLLQAWGTPWLRAMAGRADAYAAVMRCTESLGVEPDQLGPSPLLVLENYAADVLLLQAQRRFLPALDVVLEDVGRDGRLRAQLSQATASLVGSAAGDNPLVATLHGGMSVQRLRALLTQTSDPTWSP